MAVCNDNKWRPKAKSDWKLVHCQPSPVNYTTSHWWHVLSLGSFAVYLRWLPNTILLPCDTCRAHRLSATTYLTKTSSNDNNNIDLLLSLFVESFLCRQPLSSHRPPQPQTVVGQVIEKIFCHLLNVRFFGQCGCSLCLKLVGLVSWAGWLNCEIGNRLCRTKVLIRTLLQPNAYNYFPIESFMVIDIV